MKKNKCECTTEELAIASAITTKESDESLKRSEADLKKPDVSAEKFRELLKGEAHANPQ